MTSAHRLDRHERGQDAHVAAEEVPPGEVVPMRDARAIGDTRGGSAAGPHRPRRAPLTLHVAASAERVALATLCRILLQDVLERAGMPHPLAAERHPGSSRNPASAPPPLPPSVTPCHTIPCSP